MPNSQAVATLTIQDQDLLNTAGPVNLVARVAAQVITQPALIPGGVFYSGYFTVSSTVNTALFAVASPFVYVRNVTQSSDSTYSLQVQFTQVSTINVILQPGGIFLYANPVPVNGSIQKISAVGLACANAAGVPLIVEYMYVL